MKITINNIVPNNSCILWYKARVGGYTYICYGDTFDEAIEYFMEYFYRPWMEALVMSYYYISSTELHQLSTCC